MCEALNLEKIKKSILELPEKEVYHRHLMGHRLWLFEEKIKTVNPAVRHDELKGFISDSLSINFNNIAIVGTAKTGHSFNPTKGFRLFSDESDIDLVLVSPKYFHQFWDAYTEIQTVRSLPNYKEVASSIFRKFVTIPEENLPDHHIFNEWEKLAGPFKRDIQTKFGIINEIKYRIYDSWEAVETYHITGIRVLKKQLSK